MVRMKNYIVCRVQTGRSVSLLIKLEAKRTAIYTPTIRNIETINVSRLDAEYIRITEKLEKIR